MNSKKKQQIFVALYLAIEELKKLIPDANPDRISDEAFKVVKYLDTAATLLSPESKHMIIGSWELEKIIDLTEKNIKKATKINSFKLEFAEKL
jgi:hypothetical protein